MDFWGHIGFVEADAKNNVESVAFGEERVGLDLQTLW